MTRQNKRIHTETFVEQVTEQRTSDRQVNGDMVTVVRKQSQNHVQPISG